LLKTIIRMKMDDIEQKSRLAMENLLGEVPFISKVEITGREKSPGGRNDFLVSLEANGRRLRFLAEAGTSGQPRFAREAVNRFIRWKEEDRGFDAYPIFMAPFVSERAAAICRESGVGYLDLAGNAYISFGSIFISREGRKNPFVSTRRLKSIYQPKSARILRVLLLNPKRDWKLQDLSDEAEVSLGQAANVKKGLRDREWIRESPDGFRLSDPRALLLDWANNYSFEKNQIARFYTLAGPEDAEKKIAEVCGNINVEYALTAFSAAARIAPGVRYNRVTAYLSGRVNDVAGSAGFKRVESGANVILALPADEGVFYKTTEADGTRIVSPVQVFLDLFGSKARGREAAEVVLKQVLEPIW
jgi:hypothetical protein